MIPGRRRRSAEADHPRLLSLRFEAWDLGFALFPLALLWRPLFAGEVFFWGTPLLQFVPWQRMAATMWRAGHLPLWNPLVGCGAPLAANYQTAAFYPLNALALVLPAEVALSWTTALHIALTGWAMYRWARAIGVPEFPSFLGALSLMGSGFLVARAALFPSVALTFPWLAVWLWRSEMLVRHRRLREALWLGVALGLGLLAGHAQTAFYGLVLVLAYVVFRAGQMSHLKRPEAGSWRSMVQGWPAFVGRPTLRLTMLVLCAFVAGLGLAAVQLVPTAELMRQSQRSVGVTYDSAVTYSLWPWRLLTFIAPDLFGHPGRGDYWGYATYWEDAAFIGVLPLLLAARAVVGKRKTGTGAREGNAGRAGQIWFWTACALVGLLLALGKHTPVFPFLFRHVPTFNLFQAPARWLAVTTVALAALTALGAQGWLVVRQGQQLGARWLVVGVALIAGGLVAPRLARAVRPTFGPATARLGVMLAVAGALALLRRQGMRSLGARRERWWQIVVGVFVALDLLIVGWLSVPSVDRSLYQGQTQAAATVRAESGLVRAYWPTDPAHRDRAFDAEQRVKFGYLTFGDFGPGDADHWWQMRDAQLPNVAMLDDLAVANNFDPLLVGRHVDLLTAAMSDPGLLRIMGVTHIVSDRDWPESELVYQGALARMSRLPDALGRAWVVPVARQVPPGEPVTALSDPAFNPILEVLVTETPHPHPGSPSLPSAPQTLTLRDAPNRVTIRAILNEPGYLVLADTWYPGWQASVDGSPAPLLRANHAFRAVWLEAGEHVVEMRYRPASVRWGGAITLVALTGLILGLVVFSRR